MPVYMEPGSVLKGNRIFAQARRILKPRQVRKVLSGQTVIYESTKLIQSAYCVIEKPMCIVLK